MFTFLFTIAYYLGMGRGPRSQSAARDSPHLRTGTVSNNPKASGSILSRRLCSMRARDLASLGMPDDQRIIILKEQADQLEKEVLKNGWPKLS